MNEPFSPDEQRQRVTTLFNVLAEGYDTLGFVERSAAELVAAAELQPGASVLDVATGTGAVALLAARAVGPSGRVSGVDISTEMLSKARAKLDGAGLDWVELHAGDAANLHLPDESCDIVTCGLSLFFLPDMPAALQEWRRVLRPGGRLLFTSFGTGFQQPLADLFAARLARFGGQYQQPPQRLSDQETCRRTLEAAGFRDVEISTEQIGYHLADADAWWNEIWFGARRPSVDQLSPEQREQFRKEHLAEVAALATEKGIWLDVPLIVARGRK